MQTRLDGRGKREPIPQPVKVAVWQRDGGRCVECGGQENLEFDHVIPLALGGGEPGNELQTPMAIVILGGLLSATALNMIVLPALYWMFGERAADVSVERGESGALSRAVHRDPEPLLSY